MYGQVSTTVAENTNIADINVAFNNLSQYNGCAYIPIAIKKKVKKYPDSPFEREIMCKFALQTPKLFTPFGASAYQDTNPHPNYTVQMSCEENSVLLKMLTALDDRIIEQCAKNETFLKMLQVKKTTRQGKPKTEQDIIEDVANKYTAIVKEGLEKKNGGGRYPPTFKAKVVRDKNKRIETVCQIDDSLVPLTDSNIAANIPKQAMCRCVVLFPQLWVINRKFGVTCKLMRIRVYPPANMDTQFSFLSCSDDEEDTKAKPVEPVKNPSPSPEESEEAPNQVQIDSPEEDDFEDDI